MRILGYTIERHPSLLTNPLSLVFLGLIVSSFYSATIQSGYFANYRFGNSIIPREEQLIRSGPYVMDWTHTRHGYFIKFLSTTGSDEYIESSTNFNSDVDILKIVKVWENYDLPGAYLWIYPGNPVRKVWKIEVDKQTVFSYERALFIYQFESDPGFMLVAAISCFVMFLLSMISIERVKNSSTQKLGN